MNAATMALLAQLAQTGVILYSQYADASKAKDVSTALALMPLIKNVYNAITQTNAVLQQAQSEGWTDDDARWIPVLDAGETQLILLEAKMGDAKPLVPAESKDAGSNG